MNSQEQSYSPLSQKEKITSNNIGLQQIEFLGKLNLRLQEDDAEVSQIVEEYLNYNLPKIAGEVTGNNETRVLWLGPNEYLILCENEKKDNIINELNISLTNSFYSIVDVSDYYLTMRLSGPKSIDVLSVGTCNK